MEGLHSASPVSSWLLNLFYFLNYVPKCFCWFNYTMLTSQSCYLLGMRTTPKWRMELILLFQLLERASPIPLCTSPSQVLTISHRLLLIWDTQILVLECLKETLCFSKSTSFLMVFSIHPQQCTTNHLGHTTEVSSVPFSLRYYSRQKYIDWKQYVLLW